MAITYAFPADKSLTGAAMARQDDIDLKNCCSHLLQAANDLSYVQNREENDEYANHLYTTIGWIRDLAESLKPTVEDWGGDNVIPFVPRHRA